VKDFVTPSSEIYSLEDVVKMLWFAANAEVFRNTRGNLLRVEFCDCHVTVNPKVSFGRPCVLGTGIKTSVVAARIAAGETVTDVAKDYGISEEAVRGACRFEGVTERNG
jgi:uncharacterized protein (DUF433 family)